MPILRFERYIEMACPACEPKDRRGDQKCVPIKHKGKYSCICQNCIRKLDGVVTQVEIPEFKRSIYLEVKGRMNKIGFIMYSEADKEHYAGLHETHLHNPRMLREIADKLEEFDKGVK